METSEKKKRKLLGQLVAAANKIIASEGYKKADHVIVPDKNIEAIAKKFNISVEAAQEMLREYFAQRLN